MWKNFFSKRVLKQYLWFDYINHSQNLQIKHKLNSGSTNRIANYYPDGIDLTTNTIYNFNWYLFHAHSHISKKCTYSSRNAIDKLWTDKASKLYQRTIKIENIYRILGYKVISIWECIYDITISDKAKSFQSRYVPPYYNKNRSTLTQEKKSRDVFSGDLFGFMQVDKKCPQGGFWPANCIKPYTDLTPTQFYSESPPIFASTNVDFSELGAMMQDHIMKMNLSVKPHRYLIVALECEKLLLCTTYEQYLMSIWV